MHSFETTLTKLANTGFGHEHMGKLDGKVHRNWPLIIQTCDKMVMKFSHIWIIYSDVAINRSSPVTDQNWIQYLLYLNQLWYIFIWNSHLVEQVFDFQSNNVLLECLVNQFPQVAQKLGCHYQALDWEPFLEIQMCMFLALIDRKNVV